jgi:signal transduction histidine kinase
MGFAAIAKDAGESWVICRVKNDIGFKIIPGGRPVASGMVLDTFICQETGKSGGIVVIENVETDPFYQGHPASKMDGFKSYISVPIHRKDGNFFGTLCAIDSKPANINNEQTIGMFKLFADLVSCHLKNIEDLELEESRLNEEERNARLREMFVGILGHDLRNPIGSILMATEIILQSPLDEETSAIVETIKRSAFRISAITENVLDFAKSKSGNGLSPKKLKALNLEHQLLQVVGELKTIYPGQQIISSFNITEPVYCDLNQLGKLLSNLLNNAITHGRQGSPVSVEAATNKSGFKLTVSNYFDGGFNVNPEILFQPFSTANNRHGKKGLGLGLFIASEIAKAHGGTINLSTQGDRISFNVTIPHPGLQNRDELQ